MTNAWSPPPPGIGQDGGDPQFGEYLDSGGVYVHPRDPQRGLYTGPEYPPGMGPSPTMADPFGGAGGSHIAEHMPLGRDTGETGHLLPVVQQLQLVARMLEKFHFPQYQNQAVTLPAASGLAAGALLGSGVPLNFAAHSLIVDNPSGYTLFFGSLQRWVPPNVFGYYLVCDPAVSVINCQVLAGSQAAATAVTIVASQNDAFLSTVMQSGGGASAPFGSVNATITGPLDGDNRVLTDVRGATNFANSGVACLVTVTQLVPARATRTRLVVSNLDVTNFIVVGAGAVSLTNGVKIPAGGNKDFFTTTAVSAIASTLTCQVGVIEEYSN